MSIITFYSFKGGVGRTMAMANVGCSIAAKGRKVLLVDWDLEAPGLHRYFANYENQAPKTPGGTIALLETMSDGQLADSEPFEGRVTIPKTNFFPGCAVSLLAAGIGTEDYEQRVLAFELEDFYRIKKGASKLEKLRQKWRDRFDFVFIDSRTGITDTGGVCTIFLPDTLVLVFTANEQSLEGAIDVARRAQRGRQGLSFDRRGLTFLPVPSRFDSRTEQEEADQWMKRFSDELSGFMTAWCPREIATRTLLERIKIPHVPYFSFGEKLPIVTHTATDPDLPGFYYQNIAGVIEGDFSEGAILAACGITKEFRSDVNRIVHYAPAILFGREDELALLNETWFKVRRSESQRPQVITFVAMGGEGKTSLVAKWTAQLAHEDWPGCEAAFAWSFYSQGTRDQVTASADVFLKEALTFFGEPEIGDSAQSAFEKGKRLAQLVGERRSLLILDGLEPLQFAPTSPTPGEIKDQGLAVLLKSLAAANNGLCIVTTRHSIPDLRGYWQTTAPEIKLARLSNDAGVGLLRALDVKGTETEFERLVEDVSGHALTLNLLGTYLRDAHSGDIRKRDLVKLEEADAEEQGGHAFRVMDAEVREFEREGEKGKRAIAILRLLGLFDRPATADAIAALISSPVIPGLTDTIVSIGEAQRNLSVKRLEDSNLLTVNRDSLGTLVSLDAHPLLREYFARRLREEQPEAWRAAHQRLYEHFCKTNSDRKRDPTLEDLQPLYQAVTHGCQAQLQQEAFDRVYYQRILRGNENYSVRNLGAFGSELGAISCFFDAPWNRISTRLSEPVQARILNQSAYALRALGRLTEALEPMRAGREMLIEQQNWRLAAISASNVSELELTLGGVSQAVADAEQAVTYADRSGDALLRQSMRHTHADALHQSGRRLDAETIFREAEQMQAESQPDYPLLYSLPGFRYCDLLLDNPTREAWLAIKDLRHSNKRWELISICEAVAARARQTLKWAEAASFVLYIALHHLILGRAMLCRSLFGEPEIRDANIECEKAIGSLRRAGQQQELPRGLLTRSWLRFSEGDDKGARADLDEAWEIAERGPMKLFMADIHLYRARLFHKVEPYPWNKFDDGREGRGPKDDLDAAEELINKCGYHRRDEELADAKLAILGET